MRIKTLVAKLESHNYFYADIFNRIISSLTEKDAGRTIRSILEEAWAKELEYDKA